MRNRIIALGLAASFTVCGGIALAQQDRYTLKLGNLAFSISGLRKLAGCGGQSNRYPAESSSSRMT